MKNNHFEIALQRVLKHEGGYVNNAKDKGGETNYGVTVGVARQFGYMGSMRTIPLTVVEKIYKKQYWDAMDCDNYPLCLGFLLFDAAVNHGVINARKLLQRAAGVKDDGVIGAISRAAIDKYPASQLALLFHAKRTYFYTSLAQFPTFGRGWINRVAQNTLYLAEDLPCST